MSVVAKQVNVVSSVDGLLALVVGVIKDVQAGKTPAQVVADAVPALVSALSGLGDLKADVVDKKDVEVTVALRIAEVVNALAP